MKLPHTPAQWYVVDEMPVDTDAEVRVVREEFIEYIMHALPSFDHAYFHVGYTETFFIVEGVN